MKEMKIEKFYINAKRRTMSCKYTEESGNITIEKLKGVEMLKWRLEAIPDYFSYLKSELKLYFGNEFKKVNGKWVGK